MIRFVGFTAVRLVLNWEGLVLAPVEVKGSVLALAVDWGLHGLQWKHRGFRAPPIGPTFTLVHRTPPPLNFHWKVDLLVSLSSISGFSTNSIPNLDPNAYPERFPYRVRAPILT